MKDLKEALIHFVAMLIVALVIWAMVCICMILGKLAFVKTYAVEFPAITEPCGLSSEELEGKLRGNLKSCSDAFLQAEKDYGINACFLAGLATIESGSGTSKVAKNHNNLFGWRGGSGWKDFESYEQCIDWVAWRIYKNYIRPDGKHYHGATIKGISVSYCAGEQSWIDAVTNCYYKLQN